MGKNIIKSTRLSVQMLRIVLSVVSVLLIALLTFFNVRRWTKKPIVQVIQEEVK